MTAPPERGFRAEVHGLRGVAIALVVIYHVWIGRPSGGVDVFLAISAYFCAAGVMRRLERGEGAGALDHAARMLKRLLPPAAATILVTVVLALALMPASRWITTLHDGLWSLLQVENWALIARASDYGASRSWASPFQHFWSLSVQAQVLLALPVVLGAVGLVARRLGLPARPLAVAVLIAATAASLACSVHATAQDQAAAYFDTRARIWEFGLGALLALGGGPLERALAGAGAVRRALRLGLGWAGLAVLVGCGLALDVQGAFPGWIAVVPLLGAAAVILAGRTHSRWGADRLLSTRPAAFLGDVSYAFYLVHWPLLIIWLAFRREQMPGALEGAAIIVLSLLLARLLTRRIDTPVRRWPWADARPSRGLAVATSAALVAALPVIGTETMLERAEARAIANADARHPGARALQPEVEAPPIERRVLPSPAFVAEDWNEMDGVPCTGDAAPADPLLAQSCEMTAAPDGAPVLVIVGSSRARQQAAAIIPLAAEHGWRVVALWRDSCPFVPEPGGSADPACADHNARVTEHLRAQRPDGLMVVTTMVPHEGAEIAVPGAAALLAELSAGGTQVIAMRDQPRVPFHSADCAERRADLPGACVIDVRERMPEQRPDAEALGDGGAAPVDLTEATCPGGTCTPVIGGVVVFLDGDHLTRTYARSLRDEAETQLADGGWRW